MFDYNLTPELFAAIFGAASSLFFSWMPYVRTWFAGLNDEQKQLTMILLALLTAIFIGVSSCADLWTFVTCDKAGIMRLVEVFIVFLVANQGIFLVTPKARDVKALKEAE